MKNNMQDDIFDFSDQEQEMNQQNNAQQTTDTLDTDISDLDDILQIQNRFDQIKERRTLARKNKKKTAVLAIAAFLCVLIMIGTLIGFISTSITFRKQKNDLEKLTQKYEEDQNQIHTMTEQSEQLDQTIADLTNEIAKISG